MAIEHFIIEPSSRVATAERPVEYVERKGKGHPDSICDAVMEAIAVALCREYRERFGGILHHNIDKGLLVAGVAEPRCGGGSLLEPMRLIIGDRATLEYHGQRIPVVEIAEAVCRSWFRDNLRFVDPDKDLVVQNELRPGSPELVGLFDARVATANDTSAAVGYAPLTETERLVFEAERYLNSLEFKERFPETGEDVKVMGVRRGRVLYLTVALAFIDRFIPNPQAYFDRKTLVRERLSEHLTQQLRELDSVEIEINTLDDAAKGEAGVYLTVSGTSAEGADGGQVGRGNRVNGLISLFRPMSMEAAAGKNPTHHVGKIYNVFCRELANRLYRDVSGLIEVTVRMTSRIGNPLYEPWSVAIDFIPHRDADPGEIVKHIRSLTLQEVSDIGTFVVRLTEGQIPVVV